MFKQEQRGAMAGGFENQETETFVSEDERMEQMGFEGDSESGNPPIVNSNPPVNTHMDHGADATVNIDWSQTENSVINAYQSRFDLRGDETTLSRWSADPTEQTLAFQRAIEVSGVNPAAVSKASAGLVSFKYMKEANTNLFLYYYKITPPSNGSTIPRLKLAFQNTKPYVSETASKPTIPTAVEDGTPSFDEPNGFINADAFDSAAIFSANPLARNRLLNFFISKYNEKQNFKTYVNVGTAQTPLYFYAEYTFTTTDTGTSFSSATNGFMHVAKLPVNGEPQKNTSHKEMGYGEFLLDESKNNINATTNDKLGQIRGMENAPEGERLSLYYTIDTYYNDQVERNTELDLILQMPPGNEAVYYTIIINPAVDGIVNIDVKRIGKKSEVKGTAELSNLTSIENIKGFKENSATKDQLIKWLLERFEGFKEPEFIVSATDKNPILTIKNKAAAKIKAGAGTAEWFNKNYGIKILDSTAAISKIQEHEEITLDEAGRENVKSFNSADLLFVEQGLQRLDNATLEMFKNLSICRESKYETEPVSETESKTAGLTRSSTDSETGIATGDALISIYDFALESNDEAFFGGIPKDKKTIITSTANTLLHEMGHAIARKIDPVSNNGKTYIVNFLAYVDQNNITAFTKYSQDDEKDAQATNKQEDRSEFWPEAFALFHSDPEWMLKNYANLYNWFKERFN